MCTNFYPKGTSCLVLSMRPRKSCALLIFRTPDTTRASMIASSIEHAESIVCPVCKQSRYKRGKKSPQKVVWYFPLIPRLQCYSADKKEEKLMRWHKDKPHAPARDKVPRHPVDGLQWKALDLIF